MNKGFPWKHFQIKDQRLDAAIICLKEKTGDSLKEQKRRKDEPFMLATSVVFGDRFNSENQPYTKSTIKDEFEIGVTKTLSGTESHKGFNFDWMKASTKSYASQRVFIARRLNEVQWVKTGSVFLKLAFINSQDKIFFQALLDGNERL